MRNKRAHLVDPLCRVSSGSTLSASPPPQASPSIETPEHDPYELLKHEHFDPRYAPPAPTAVAIDFRHSWWATARERTRRALVDAGFPAGRRLRFQSCGASPLVQVDALSGLVRVTACHCHDRWCRACGQVKRQKLAQALGGLIGSRKTMHLVLTLKSNDDPLGKCHSRLLASFTRLRRHAWWRSKVRGGAWCFECTWNSDTRQWHAHLHTVVHAGWLQIQELSALWHQATGDSHRVHISLVNNAPSVVRELTKYVGKITHRSWSHDQQLLAHAMKELNGRRLCNTFGAWSGTELQPEYLDPTPRQWITWGSVDRMLALAKAGDADARELLAALREHRPIVVPGSDQEQKKRQRDNPEGGPAPPPSARESLCRV